MQFLELKIPPPLVTLIFGVIIWFMPNAFQIDSNRYLAFCAALVFAMGTIITLVGVVQFKMQKTTVNPMKPDQSSSMVLSGIYKYSRNPMYLGFLLWLVALMIYLANPLAFIPIGLFMLYMNRFQIGPEEKALENKFGEEYLRYKCAVRRWIGKQ